MAYLNCSHCKASNRQSDHTCYSCSKPLRAETSADSGEQAAAVVPSGYESDSSWLLLFVAVGLATAFGAGLGLSIQLSEMELPFFLEEIGLGVLCSVVTTYAVGKLKEIPEGLLLPRLIPATLFGALIGLCLFAIWWCFDPSAGFVVIGAIAGFCSGIPVAVSFGLLGGESKNLGLLEFANVGAGAFLGFVLGGFLIEDFYLGVGCAGVGGLIPCLAGGRIQALSLLGYLMSESD